MKKSKITGLPAEVKKWLDTALVDGNFSDYTALSEAIKAKGYDISKSSIHRYGSQFEERLSALKLITEQARVIVSQNPDDDDALNQALIKLTQEKLFGVLMSIDVDPAKIDIAELTRSIAGLGKTSLSAKKHAMQARREAKIEAANAAVKTGEKLGLSAEQLQEIRESIYAILPEK